jgi:putative NIF3 family GTP cyclohydrolase 1 type 2
MPYTLSAVRDVVDQLWPVEGAEGWDAPGLVSGDPAASVGRILLAVDAVADTVEEAVSSGAGLLLTHHPLLLRGVTTVAEDTYKGAMLSRLIRGGCALLSAHTNADVVAEGVSDVLAGALGIVRARPIVPGRDASTGTGRVGELAEPTTLGALARRVADLLPPTASGVRVAGDYAVVGSDVFITADLRHHPASEARERALIGRGPALMDVSHWASEWLWLDVAAGQLARALPGVDVQVSDARTDPWDFAVVQ